MTMPFDLSDRIFLVTGGARGLGRASAELLSRSGATVGIVDIDASTIEEAANAIRTRGGSVHALAGDVGNRDVFLLTAADFAQRCGRIDGIVNAAMWIQYEPVADVRGDTFERMLDVGLKAPLWAAQALLAHRDPSRPASLVNFTSPAADQGYSNTSVYAAIKGGVRSLTRTLAVELGPLGVRVNSITPGAVPTPGARAVVDDAGYEQRRRKTPLGRLGREEDIAAAVAFLLSDEADFINGATLHVDGGISVSAG
jgi:NAD(P)-dependent dehydrogenase (short-subunit alcohol dehydrogenase family)